MGFTVSALTNYTNEQNFPLIRASIFGAMTAKMLNKQTGIKSASTINILASQVGFQTGGTCGFSTSGTTTLSQRTITVGKIKINQSWCPKDLEAKYTQTQLAPGSKYENLTFEQIITDELSEHIAESLEVAIWTGDTTLGNANLNKFDGLLKIIDAASGVVSATSQAAINSSTVRGIMQDIYTKIPVQVLNASDMVVFCGFDTFRTYQNKLATDNLYHITGQASNYEMFIENSPLKLVAVNGLNSTNRIIAARTSNLFIGVDLENEEEKWELFYAKEADEMRWVVEFKYGTQIAFPSEIVKYANS
jgi:hypothetical protein